MTEQQKNFCLQLVKDAANEGLVHSWEIFEEDLKESSFNLINRGYEAIVTYFNRIPQLKEAPRLRMRLIDKAFNRMLALRASMAD